MSDSTAAAPEDRSPTIHHRAGWEKGYTKIGPFRVPNPHICHFTPMDMKITIAVASYAYGKKEWYISDRAVAEIAGCDAKSVQRWRLRIPLYLGLVVTVGDGRSTATRYRIAAKMGKGRVVVNRTAKRRAQDHATRKGGHVKVDIALAKGGLPCPPSDEKGGPPCPPLEPERWTPMSTEEVSTAPNEVRDEGSKPPKAGGIALSASSVDLARLKVGSIKRVLATLPMNAVTREAWGTLARERMADGATEHDLLLVLDYGRSAAEHDPFFRGHTDPKYLWSAERFLNLLQAARAWKRTNGTGKLYEPLGRQSSVENGIEVGAKLVLQGQGDPDDYLQECRAEGMLPAEVHASLDRAQDRIEQNKLDEAARKAKAIEAARIQALPTPPKPETWTQRKAKAIATVEARINRLIDHPGDLVNDKAEWKRQCDAANADLNAVKAKTADEWRAEIAHDQEQEHAA